MSFLTPGLLWLFPLAALPIVIHLLHQRRYRTVPWAAMMFLLDAKRQSRGMARLRHFLILAMRVLAILALAFAIKRPLASGSLGWAIGGAPDTILVLLDRSASMENQDLATGNSKRTTALAKLAELLSRTSGGSKIVLIESTTLEPQELGSPKALIDVPSTDGTVTSSDVSSMMQVAQDYINENQTGRTDVWICSDLAENDWQPDSGRWDGVRQGFEALEGVRFYLLTYIDPPKGNYGVTVENVTRRDFDGRTELVLDIRVDRSEDLTKTAQIPLDIVVEGTRTVIQIDISEDEYTLQGYAIPIDSRLTDGWGSVSLPNDSNPTDNTYYFVFAEEPVRQTIIVTDDDVLGDSAQIATTAPSDPGLEFQAEILPSARTAEIPWESAGLIIWHARLPKDPVAKLLQTHVDAGRNVLFMPPEAPDDTKLYGVKWGEWVSAPDGDPFRVNTWRDDAGLLANTQSGAALPVGELKVYEYCELEGPETHLASFADGQPLLTSVSTDHGGVYFLSTLPKSGYSTFATEGVVYYVMLHRALDRAARSLSPARTVTAGNEQSADAPEWEPLNAETKEHLSVLRPYNTGVFRDGEKLFAINRDPAEDGAKPIDETTLEPLLGGLDYQRIEDKVGNEGSLASEIWRIFLIVMAGAMILEAALCIPAREHAVDTRLFQTPTAQR
jgi:hypothetical protein